MKRIILVLIVIMLMNCATFNVVPIEEDNIVVIQKSDIPLLFGIGVTFIVGLLIGIGLSEEITGILE